MLIIGHRGASKMAPENTLAAFDLAIAQRAHGVEADTYQVGAQNVVIHDRWLNRTTNGEGMVTHHSLDHLRSLDAGNGERIPTVRDVFSTLPNYALFNIEIKHLSDVKTWIEDVTLGMEQAQFPEQNLIVSSFNHRWLRHIKVAWPSIKIGALTATYPETGLGFADDLNAYSIHMALDVVDEHYVKEAQKAGLKVLVYTVDQPSDITMLANWGVDGIFTNVPDIAIQTVGALHSSTQ